MTERMNKMHDRLDEIVTENDCLRDKLGLSPNDIDLSAFRETRFAQQQADRALVAELQKEVDATAKRARCARPLTTGEW